MNLRSSPVKVNADINAWFPDTGLVKREAASRKKGLQAGQPTYCSFGNEVLFEQTASGVHKAVVSEAVSGAMYECWDQARPSLLDSCTVMGSV